MLPLRPTIRPSRLLRAAIGLLVVAMLSACNASAPTSSPSPQLSPTLGPIRAIASADPCTTAVTHLAVFVDRLGSEVPSLRTYVTAESFDSPTTAARIRAVSATLQAYQSLDTLAATCSSTSPVAADLKALHGELTRLVEASTDGSINDARLQRSTAAKIFAFMPRLIDLAGLIESAVAGSSNAREIALATATSKPIGQLPPLPTPTPAPTPRPTPKPLPPPKVAAFGTSYFGSKTKVQTYAVTGSTPAAIHASTRAHGPYSDWLKGRATGLTKPAGHYQFQLANGFSGCRVVATGRPLVWFSFVIVLPRWTPPRETPLATYSWWNSFIREVAAHEKRHVDLYRSGGVRMSKAVAASTCANVQSKLEAAYRTLRVQNCEFDMKEYGSAAGLSYTACVNR